MATLTADITADAEQIPTDATEAGYYTIDSENVRLTEVVQPAVPHHGDPPTGKFYALRGLGGTTAATHSSGATLTRYYPDAASAPGGGGVTVTDGTTTVDATSIRVAKVTDDAGEAKVSSVIVSEEDPEAIGAGNLWLDPDVFDDNEGYIQLYLRNELDDDWDAVTPKQQVTGSDLIMSGTVTSQAYGAGGLAKPAALTCQDSNGLVGFSVNVSQTGARIRPCTPEVRARTGSLSAPTTRTPSSASLPKGRSASSTSHSLRPPNRPPSPTRPTLPVRKQDSTACLRHFGRSASSTRDPMNLVMYRGDKGGV